MSALVDLDPRDAAAALAADHDEAWLTALADALDRRLSGRRLDRVMRLWQLSRTELGALFGVSRQAVTKWLADGVPAERVEQVADVQAITDLLDHYLKRDRIPAVVRRRAPALGSASLLELVVDGQSSEALRLTRQMFAFTDVHA
jgi:hypothetical protein